MDILQYINKMNRLYGNDPTPVRFNTQKYLQGGRVGFASGSVQSKKTGRFMSSMSDPVGLLKFLKNYKGKSIDKTEVAKRFGFKDSKSVHDYVKKADRLDLLELPPTKQEPSRRTIQYLKSLKEGSDIAVQKVSDKLGVDRTTVENVLKKPEIKSKKLKVMPYGPKYLSQDEFLNIIKKEKGKSAAAVAQTLNEKGYTMRLGDKFTPEAVQTRLERAGLTGHGSKIPVWTDKQILAEAERLQSVFPRAKLDLKNMNMEEIRRRTLMRRAEEKKKLRIQKGDQEYIQRLKKYAKKTYADAKKDPERWARIQEGQRKYRAARTFGLAPTEYSGKGFLFRDLIGNATMFQEGKLQNSHIKFKNPKQVQPTSIPQTQAIELLDINVLDKKGKPKVITYDNVEKHIDKYYADKKFGMSSKEVINEYEKKRFIHQNPELRNQLNKKLYAAYDPANIASRRFFSPFHIHHTAGRANNAFNVQLTTGSDNVKEGGLRREFNSNFKSAKTLGDKKAALKKYVDAVPENVEVRVKKVPYGQRVTLIEQLEKMAGKDIKLTPEVKAQAMKLYSFPGMLEDPAFLMKETVKGGKLAAKGLGRTALAALGPTGIAGITYGAGFDPKSATDRMGVAAEAALAPELVKASIGATKGMKSRAAQKVVQQLLNLGLPTQTALRVARAASPLGLLALGGEGLYKMYKEGHFEKERMMPSLMDKEAYAGAQKEKFDVSKPMFKSGGKVEYDNYLPDIDDDK